MTAMLAIPFFAFLLAQGQSAPSTTKAQAPAPTATDRDPYALIQKAKAHFDRGEFPRVLEIVDVLLREYPRSQSSHLLRALALDGLGRLDEAKLSYEAALRIAPKDPQILARFGMHFMQREAWGEAIRQLERSLAVAPDADALFYLAQAYFHTENKGKAVEAIERCAALAPANPTVLLKLGEYRAQARKYSPALEALLKAQALNPDEPGLDLALGVVQLALLEVKDARTALERAEKKDPENPAILANLAEACAKARDHAAARRYYQKLLDLGLRDAHSYLGLGIALVGLRDYEAAILALDQAAEQNPKLAEAHFHLVRAHRAAGHTDLAQRELRTFTALKASPFRPFEERTDLERSLWRRVEALVKEGKEAEALTLLAAGNAPGNQPAYLVGALYYSLGRLPDAERLLTEALQAAPTLLKLRAYLGLTYLEQGRLAQAERAINEEIEQNPREPLVLMAAGQLHFRKKDWVEAARYLEESRVVDPAVLLMLCEARLEAGQPAQAQETAQLIATLAAGNARTLAAVNQLFDRHHLQLEIDPTPAATVPGLPKPAGSGGAAAPP
jgi:tetratricopeptide (TPR) repeat protein